MTSCPPEQRVLSIQAATAFSQGQRSSSVSGVPLCILSTLEAGWNQSAASNSHLRRRQRTPPTGDLPHPETPITIITLGAEEEAPSRGVVSMGINLLVLARRHDL